MKAQESFVYVVGVDVSKAKLDIALPNESLTIKNNTAAIQQLVDRIASDAVIVVMEATGGYENQLVQALHMHGIALAVVNPRRVRDFAKGIGRDAKTDPIDARVIAYYGEIVKPAPQRAKSDDAKKLGALVERRRQLLGLIGQENNRLQQVDDADIKKLIQKSLEMPKNSSKPWMSDSPKRSGNLRQAIYARSKSLGQPKGSVPLRSARSWPSYPSLAN
jgi:transposase